MPALAAAHPLPPPRIAEDTADARLRLLAGAGAADGLAASAALGTDPAGLPADLIASFRTWVAAQHPEDAGDCWITDRLEYRFGIGASTDAGEVVLRSPSYDGDRLDWYDLDVDTDPADSLATPTADVTATVANLLPTRVTFPGMPAERFWEFEDAAVNLGAISAAADDLGRLLTVEFATVFGNDWWSVPVRAGFGSVVGVRSLVVSDTFGEHVLIEPTSTAAVNRSTRRGGCSPSPIQRSLRVRDQLHLCCCSPP